MRIQDLELFLNTYSRYIITVVMAITAMIIIWWLWVYYQVEPWTRDGRVRADIVRVAPDVSGLVKQVYVKDNQVVQRGQPLFLIDQDRFTLALDDAEAKVMSIKSALAESRREDTRNVKLGNLVSKEVREQTSSRTEQLIANLNQAISNRNTAKLDLVRSEVRAPVNGVVTNFDLQPGNYAVRGQQVLAIVDSDTLRVEGYFEETKLPNIHINNKAFIYLMGEKAAICGHVESIAAGIEDRERSASSNQLANINPTFNWVRLAQRIPVRIQLDHIPKDVRLIAGRTATVKIVNQKQTEAGKKC